MTVDEVSVAAAAAAEWVDESADVVDAVVDEEVD